MNNRKIILIGAGGHALSCIDTIEQENYFKIGGLVGLENEVDSYVGGYKVLATDSDLKKMIKHFRFAIVTVGQIKSARNRIKLFSEANQIGFELPTIASPTAYVSQKAQIGKGTIILHGAIINTGVKIGNNCIINSRVLIEHSASISNHCHISTGAILNGDNFIGARSFVGSGAILKQGVSIGKDCLIGMGQLVFQNVENFQTISRNPK